MSHVRRHHDNRVALDASLGRLVDAFFLGYLERSRMLAVGGRKTVGVVEREAHDAVAYDRSLLYGRSARHHIAEVVEVVQGDARQTLTDGLLARRMHVERVALADDTAIATFGSSLCRRR